MKILTAVICFCLPAVLFGQKGSFGVKGKIASLNSPAKLYLVYDDTVRAASDLRNGEFEFSGAVNHPYTAYITLNKAGNGFTSDNYAKFYLEAGNIVLKSSDTLAKAHFIGTKNNDANESYKALLAPIEKRDDKLYARDTNATEEQKKSVAFLHELELLNKKLEDDRKEANKRFILNNPSSLVSLDALYSFAQYSPYNNTVVLYRFLSPDVRNSPEGVAYAEELKKMGKVAIGQIAPDFALPDTNNNNVSLSSFRGKYLLLDFWASWCPLCRQANPGIVKTYNEYKNKNFTILGVSLDKEGARKTWLDAIHHDGLTWTQLSELKFWKGKAAELYHLTALPQNFLIDPDGKIIARQLDGPALSAKLAEIFGQ